MYTRKYEAKSPSSSPHFLSSLAKPGTSTSSQIRLFRIDSTLHCLPSRAISRRSQSASCSLVSSMWPERPISLAQFRCHIVALPTERSRSEGPDSLSELRDGELKIGSELRAGRRRENALPAAAHVADVVRRLLAPAAPQLLVRVEVDESIRDACNARACSV